MITTKNPLPGNLYLVKHSGGIRNVLLYIHEDGNASSAWVSCDGKRIHRFQAFDEPGAKGDNHWVNDIRNSSTWYGVFVCRPERKQPHTISDADIEAIYDKFNAYHGW